MTTTLPPYSCEVHARVEKHRDRLGITHQELADTTGVALSELRGTRSLLVTSVVVLADFYGVTVEEMFGVDGRNDRLAMEPTA